MLYSSYTTFGNVVLLLFIILYLNDCQCNIAFKFVQQVPEVSDISAVWNSGVVFDFHLGCLCVVSLRVLALPPAEQRLSD